MKKILFILSLVQSLYTASICYIDNWTEGLSIYMKSKYAIFDQRTASEDIAGKKYDLLIFNNSLPKRRLLHKSIYLPWEPDLILSPPKKHTTKCLHKIFTWNHSLANANDKYEKMFFPEYHGLHKSFKPFPERKFACIINSHHNNYIGRKNELYSERKKIAYFYDKHYPYLLSLFGKTGWKIMNLSVYKGAIPSKNTKSPKEYWDVKGPVLRDHKFCYCYENNLNDQHYISEKILHCIRHRCVPIYLGCNNITDYIPKDLFIDAREFSSIEDIHAFLENIDEEKWNKYIQAMEKFDKSDNAKLFTPEYFCKRLEKIIDNYLKDKNIN